MNSEEKLWGGAVSQGTCAFIKLDPVMDLEKATWLEKEFEKIVLEGKRKIYLDFSDVGFLCSYMMRVFIKFRKTWTRAGVRMGIQNSNEYSDNTLRIAGLGSMFTLSDKWQEECNIGGNEDNHIRES
jgi:anti-anti-sigma factor